MKKISILSLCLAAGLGASAQQNVVKDAERAMKDNKPFSEVVTIITPAFSDPTTSNQAATYFIPGKAGFNEYNALLGQRSLGRADEKTPKKMADALLGGYGYFLKALPLDSLPDAKGKIKPKYSKQIYSEIAGHMNDFSNAAVDMWNDKNYKGAYEAWGIYLDLARDERFTKLVPAIADSLLCDIAFNQALAAWQAEDLAASLKSFRNARALGYSKKPLFEYALAVANAAQDNDALLEFATEGNKIYGHEDIQFLNQIINYYLQTEKYDEALNYLAKGIEEDPNNAQYYALRGIIYDNQKDMAKAHTDYAKALEINPNNGLALFYMGRNIAASAGAEQDAYDKPDYEQFKKNTIDPKYREAAGYLEKAYDADPNNRSEILKLLEILYYNLNDEAGLNSVKERKDALD